MAAAIPRSGSKVFIQNRSELRYATPEGALLLLGDAQTLQLASRKVSRTKELGNKVLKPHGPL
jgi:hypothetical protein